MKLKPYPKYKDSGIQWIGKIPEWWEVNRLKFLLETPVTDGPHETPEFIDEGIPFLSVDSIQDGKLVFENCRHISEKDYIRFKTKCNPQKNDALMGKAASIGKIAIVDVDFEFSIWSPLALLRPNQTRIIPKVLEYVLKSDYSQHQIEIFATSNTQKNISMDDIPRMSLITPSLPDQTAIANFLDNKTARIDTLIEKNKKLIALLKEKRTVLINHAVTKGLDPNVKLKDSWVDWIGEIPEGWEVRKVSRSFDFIGSGTTPKTQEEIYYDKGDIPWVITGDLNDGLLKETSKRISKEAVRDYSTLKIYPKNSLIIAMYGATIGKTALLDIEACTNQACCVLAKSKIFETKYVFYWFIANKNNIISYSYGGGQPNISQDIIKTLKILLPPKPEQQKIVEYLDKATSRIDKTIKLIEKKIELLEDFKKSLIHYVVTGKVDVRGVEA